MGEEETPEMVIWGELLDTYRKLKAAKTNDFSEKDRRYAVMITMYEQMLAYYNMMISQEFIG